MHATTDIVLNSLQLGSIKYNATKHPPQGRERSSPDHRRFSMLDPSTLDSEVTRLRQRLLSTEDALRNAMEHNQHVDQLVQAMGRHPDKSPVRH